MVMNWFTVTTWGGAWVWSAIRDRALAATLLISGMYLISNCTSYNSKHQWYSRLFQILCDGSEPKPDDAWKLWSYAQALRSSIYASKYDGEHFNFGDGVSRFIMLQQLRSKPIHLLWSSHSWIRITTVPTVDASTKITKSLPKSGSLKMLLR